jgi:hypothetical protein
MYFINIPIYLDLEYYKRDVHYFRISIRVNIKRIKELNTRYGNFEDRIYNNYNYIKRALKMLYNNKYNNA